MPPSWTERFSHETGCHWYMKINANALSERIISHGTDSSARQNFCNITCVDIHVVINSVLITYLPYLP